jgi:hypothetical protein
MKAKLVKTFEGYELHILNNKNNLYMPSAYFPKRASCRVYYLSKQNCDSIFGIIDVEKLAENKDGKGIYEIEQVDAYVEGFNKAMELNKDKVFTLEDMRKAYYVGYEDGKSGATFFQKLIQSIQQPIEIDVVIEDKIALDGHTILGYELDSEGCLILKKL